MADVTQFTPNRALDANGDPIPNARAYFFRTGTSTAATVYSDITATTAHPVPVLADSNGVFPAVYSDGTYVLRCIIRNASEVEVSDIDPIMVVPLSATGASSITFAPTADIDKNNVQEAIEKVQTNWTGAKSGQDDNIISGTAGNANKLGQFNADGDLVEGPGYGTSGANNLLQLNASGTLPALSGVNLTKVGGARFLASSDASSVANLTFTELDSTKYDGYRLVIGGLVPVQDNVHAWIRTSTDGGSSYDSGSSDYTYYVNNVTFAGVANAATSAGAAQIQLTGATAMGSDTNEYGLHAVVDFIMPHLSTYTHIKWSGSYTGPSGGHYAITGGSAIRLAAADVDAFRVLMSSGNIESGTVTLYGLKNSV